MGLPDDFAEQFAKNGFVIVDSFLKPEEVNGLMSRMDEMVNSFDEKTVPFFSTENHNHSKDEYFITSGDKVRFFMEEAAFTEAGDLKQAKSQSINKCAHALHTEEPLFKAACGHETIASAAKSLGFKKPTVIQSMYIFKPPNIGGSVQPHQDSTFLYTSPLSCTGCWCALHDANQENGCLWVVPGSHNRELTRKFVKGEDGKGPCVFDPVDAPAVESKGEEEWVPVEVKSGQLLIFHGQLLHRSEKNLSGKPRNALSWHFVEGGAEFPQGNWLSDNHTKLVLYED